MELTRSEIDAMLRHADEVRAKLRRATRELQRFGEQALASREERATDSREDDDAAERSADGDRSR